jgi:hypothetical protein
VSASNANEEPLGESFERAAWAEADSFLAQAWREAIATHDKLERAHVSLARAQAGAARPSAALRRLTEALDQSAFVLQFIERAATYRRMRTDGAERPYDPALHALAGGGDLSPGEAVRVHTPAVLQRRGSGDVVLARAAASAYPARREPPRKRKSGPTT